MTTQSAVTTTRLPHQSDRLYIADGGLETTFVFQKDGRFTFIRGISFIE